MQVRLGRMIVMNKLCLGVHLSYTLFICNYDLNKFDQHFILKLSSGYLEHFKIVFNCELNK